VLLQLLAGGLQMGHGQGIAVGQHLVGLLEPLQPTTQQHWSDLNERKHNFQVVNILQIMSRL